MDRRENVMDRSGNMMGAPEMKRSRLMAPSTGGAPAYGQQQQVGTAGGVGVGGTLRSSKVVSIKNLPEQTVEADLLDACGQFGAISYVQIGARGTALLEYENQRSAEECVNYNSTTDIFVLQQPVYFAFAPMEEIPRRGYESSNPSNVLVVYVNNARYPISTDVITAICKPVAQVQRIIVTRRQGVMALVEFLDAETARSVKHRLNGCDIYSGCCTLKLEFSRLNRLNVTRNDQDQWDYVGASRMGDRPSLLSDPAYPSNGRHNASATGDELGYDASGRAIFDDPYGGFGGPVEAPSAFAPTYPMGPADNSAPGYIGSVSRTNDRHAAGISAYDRGGGGADSYPPQATRRGLFDQSVMGPSAYDSRDHYADQYTPPSPYHNSEYDRRGASSVDERPDGTGMGYDNAVVMVYGMNEEKFNAERIFNIACLYGNVVCVKFLKTKADACMVQMGDPVAADRFMRAFNRTHCFGHDLQLSMSKKAYLEEMRQEPYPLPDGTPSYKMFRECRSNRFLSAAAASKNRLNPPGPVLYFFNVPTDFTEAMFNELIDRFGLAKPVSVKVFEAREGSRSCAGTAEFANTTEGVEALVMLNHEPVRSDSSRTPFLIKMTFSGPHGATLDHRDYRGSDRGRDSQRRGGSGFERSRGGSTNDYRDESRGMNGPQHMARDRYDRDSGHSRGGGGYRGRGSRGGGNDRGSSMRGGGGGRGSGGSGGRGMIIDRGAGAGSSSGGRGSPRR